MEKRGDKVCKEEIHNRGYSRKDSRIEVRRKDVEMELGGFMDLWAICWISAWGMSEKRVGDDVGCWGGRGVKKIP